MELNRVAVIGTLDRLRPIQTKDPSNAGLRFTVAVPREGKADWTDKLDAIAWGEPAKLAATINAGARVRVDGRLQRSSWNDKNTGEKKYSTEILVSKIGVPMESAPSADDDLPF